MHNSSISYSLFVEIIPASAKNKKEGIYKAMLSLLLNSYSITAFVYLHFALLILVSSYPQYNSCCANSSFMFVAHGMAHAYLAHIFYNIRNFREMLVVFDQISKFSIQISYRKNNFCLRKTDTTQPQFLTLKIN